MKTYHVKKDDKVMVNAGNYRGSEATVKAVQKRQHDAKGNPKKEVVRTLDSFSQPAKAKHKKKNRKKKGKKEETV